MKNSIFKLTLGCLILISTIQVHSQNQLKKWYLSTNQVDMTSSVPGVSAIPNSTVHAINYGTGMYKSDNFSSTPQFYISDGTVYDGSNNQFGPLNAVQWTTGEIAIVPFAGNDGCHQDKYYLLYTAHNFTNSSVYYAVIDMNSGECGQLINWGTSLATTIPAQLTGIAVGKLNGGQRFAYVSGGNAIYKMVITNSGITAPQQIASIAGEDFDNQEMDLSPDGSMLAFTYNRIFGAANPYHIIFLNSSGDFSSHTSFNVGTDNLEGGRGVEFYVDPSGVTKLIVGAGSDGIFRIDPLNPTVGQFQVLNTNSYGHSQIELASNGKIYAAGTTDVLAINVSGANPVVNTGSNISLVAPSLTNSFNGPFFTLPDQIDGENLDPITKGTMCLDLYTKDDELPGPDDTGIEPNPDWGLFYVSKDIYVHRPNYNNPSDHTSWNPIFSNPNPPHHVYVVVRNRSCRDYTPATGDVVHLYWAKASSALDWPYNWSAGNTTTCSDPGGAITHPQLGGEISPAQPIPAIPAGGYAEVPFQWTIPDPDPYYGCATWDHFCLLSRLEAPSIDDLILFEGTSTWMNTKNHNNIAWKNLTIVDGVPFVDNTECANDIKVGGTIGIGNSSEEEKTIQLIFEPKGDVPGKQIFEQADIKITLDEKTWRKWIAGGAESENLEIKREDCRQLIVKGTPAKLKNLFYHGREISNITMSFNFLTSKVDQIIEFDYNVLETANNRDKEIIGGEYYSIRKPQRYLFNADGGQDKSIYYKDDVALSARDIGEPAVYNWYNEAGELIFSGKELITSPELTQKYKLEIISERDGFTSYDDVIVNVKEMAIKGFLPNPAVDEIQIEYEASKATSAYLSITSTTSSISNNYILQVQNNSTSINISNYFHGSYLVRLICDGNVRDERVFIKQ